MILEAINSLYVEKELTLIQKGLNFIFRGASQFKSVPNDIGDIQ